MPRRRINPLTSFGVPVKGGGVLQANTEYQWFVDYNWDKGFGDGRTQDRPLKYLQDAIDNCVDYRGDVIYVGRSYTPLTSSLLFNKHGISVIAMDYGLAPKANGEYFCHDFSSTTTEPAAIISKACFIYGLGFHTGWSAANSYQVQMGDGTGGGVWGAHLKSCRFTDWGTGCDYGLRFRAGSNNLIENCSFEGNRDAAQRFVAGINFWTTSTNNPTNNQIKDCTFDYCDYAIDHRSSVNHQGLIYGPGNMTNETGSKFLKTNSLSSSGIIHRNSFITSPGNGTFDLSTPDVEALGMKLVGNEYATENQGPF